MIIEGGEQKYAKEKQYGRRSQMLLFTGCFLVHLNFFRLEGMIQTLA